MDVWTYLEQAAANGELLSNTLATLKAVFLAWAMASVVGVIIGLMLGLLPRAERVFTPFLDALNSMPRIALAPIFIIYFGIDTSAKVALGFRVRLRMS
jgi:NitT/TauT family transport system permease protein